MREEVRARRAAATPVTSSPSRERHDLEWELGELRKMVDRRVRGEPLQYILGNQPFGPIVIKTRAPTLIPRPETEDWTIRLASLLEDKFPTKDGGERKVLRMLDLCTGTGCIPILLSHLRRRAGGITVAYGVDISTDAVLLAQENATDQSLTHSSSLTGDDRKSVLDVICADILQEDFMQVILSRMEPPFGVITSNPPYIPLDEYERLPNSVKEWEDQRALLGDLPPHRSGGGSKGRGLMFYHRIGQIVSADGVLGVNGVVALEVGHTQAEEVRKILEETGKISVTEVWKDPWGVSRVVVGYR
ncbi:S-adenosyl-L-methionine-dependent methyltransferase [Thelephora ganbajun]|uniref:S-adenosyl-L-methionine-dependent methyltransferase n=1 Tax=Thelephora ganbajun TaxID=370292 RepID=A0ACB6ZVH6_THEGA|nr:S-adenosyl-L-methionine-dependent methyltransferase [Thelephora ganbajun]